MQSQRTVERVRPGHIGALPISGDLAKTKLEGVLQAISQIGGTLHPTGGCNSHGSDGRPIEGVGTNHRRVATTGRRTWTALARQPRGTERYFVDPADWGALGGSAGTISPVPDLPSSVPTLGSCGDLRASLGGAGPGSQRPRQARSTRMLHPRHLCCGETGGSCVGKTKRGKGANLMAMATGQTVLVFLSPLVPPQRRPRGGHSRRSDPRLQLRRRAASTPDWRSCR